MIHAHRFDKTTRSCPSLAIRSPRLRSTPLKNVATTGALCGTSLRCAGCLGGWSCCGSSWTRSRRPAGRRLPPCTPLAPPKTRHTSGAETGDRLVGEPGQETPGPAPSRRLSAPPPASAYDRRGAGGQDDAAHSPRLPARDKKIGKSPAYPQLGSRQAGQRPRERARPQEGHEHIVGGFRLGHIADVHGKMDEHRGSPHPRSREGLPPGNSLALLRPAWLTWEGLWSGGSCGNDTPSTAPWQ
jgi:hypothetical protein